MKRIRELKLNYREQTLLEKRLAICMTCGHVGSWKGRPTFEELAVMFEGSTASGAERAYRRAVDKLTELLVAEGAIHAVRLKQKSKTKRKKKIATAIYEYQADCDGEWGQISFDFENGTSEIVRLADWDTMKTNRFANKAIIYVLCISIICRTNRRYGNDSFAYFSNIIAFNSNWQHFKSESKVLVSNNHSNYICAICVYIL